MKKILSILVLSLISLSAGANPEPAHLGVLLLANGTVIPNLDPTKPQCEQIPDQLHFQLPACEIVKIFNYWSQFFPKWKNIPVELAFGEESIDSFQMAVDRLGRTNIDHLLVLPLTVNGTVGLAKIQKKIFDLSQKILHFPQTLKGITFGSGFEMNHSSRLEWVLKSTIPEILDYPDSQELIFLGDGAGDDQENAVWEATVSEAAKYVNNTLKQSHLDFIGSHVFTLQSHASLTKRDQKTNALRGLVSEIIQRGHEPVIVPIMTYKDANYGNIKKHLHGLNFRFFESILTPSWAIYYWLYDSIIALVQSTFNGINSEAYLYSQWLSPNEHHPIVAVPILNQSNHGAYISVGTERGFMSAGYTKAQALYVIDRERDVIHFGKINAALLAASKNIEDYRALRTQDNFDLWKARAAQMRSPEREILSDKKNFFFWYQFVTHTNDWGQGFAKLATPPTSSGPFYGFNYLFDNSLYSHLKNLALARNIRFKGLDLSFESSLAELVEDIKFHGYKIGVFDTSNVSSPYHAGYHFAALFTKFISQFAQPDSIFLNTVDSNDVVGTQDPYWNYYGYTKSFIDQKDNISLKERLELDYNELVGVSPAITRLNGGN